MSWNAVVMRRFQYICMAAALLASAAVPGLAQTSSTQTWPTQTLRLIVPFPAGGSNDVMGRLIGPHLEKALGQTVIVDNRPAAAGQVGTDAVARANPDGHTLLLVASSHTVQPALNPKLPYNTEKDFAPVTLVNTNGMFFFVHPSVPANTLAEFVELAKKEPGKYNYASPGVGSQTQLTIELLMRRTGIKLQHVPYRGGAPATQAMLSGETHFTMLAPNIIFPHIECRQDPRDRHRRPQAASAGAERQHDRRAGLQGPGRDPVGRRAHHRRNAEAGHRSPQQGDQPDHPPARRRRGARQAGRRADRQHAGGIPGADLARDQPVARHRARSERQAQLIDPSISNHSERTHDSATSWSGRCTGCCVLGGAPPR